jgi:hypothetical protein
VRKSLVHTRNPRKRLNVRRLVYNDLGDLALNALYHELCIIIDEIWKSAEPYRYEVAFAPLDEPPPPLLTQWMRTIAWALSLIETPSSK